MRTAGIIRIIIGLVIAVLLTAILVVLLTGNNIFSNLGWDGGWINNIVNRATYSSGGENSDSDEIIVSDKAQVSAQEIQKIKIDWVSGSVNLVVGSGSDIVFYETSNRTLTDKQKMRYNVSDSGTLQIRYCQNLDNILNWFSLDSNMPSKELTMEVPTSLIGLLDNVEIDSVSADINLTGVYGTKTEMDTVSGRITCTNVNVDDLEMDTTSGDVICENCKASSVSVDNVSGSVSLSGEIDQIDVDTVSGETRIASTIIPSKIEVDGVSGNIVISLPENAGFTANLDSVSGSISCDFPGTIGDDRIVVGDGSANYRFNTVSGSLKINQN
jgi:lia operon protein LiaG